MKRVLLLLCVFPALAADVSGSWHFVLVRFGEDFADARVELKTEGTKLTGTLNELKLEGAVENDVLKFSAIRPNRQPFGTLEGRVNGDQISGTVTQGEEQFAWKARRLNVDPGPPRTHTFEPVKFHRVFSGAIEPALRIQPGDTVRTWAVDAGGRDAKGVRHSLGGNPQTGPFYIEGAMPGQGTRSR